MRLPAAAQICGVKHQQLHEFLDLVGTNSPTAPVWQRVSDKVFPAVETSALASMQKAIAKAKEEPDLWVILDCRWASRGYNSEHATVFCMDGNTDKVLYTVSILRKIEQIQGRTNTDTAIYDYEGTSRGMEGFGVRTILEKCLDDGLQITHYAHDDDGCTRKIVQELYPNALEYLDIGHAAKNLKKKVITASKEDGCSQLKGFGERTQRDFRTLVRTHFDDTKTLKEKITNMTAHYSSNHANCDHAEPFEPTYKPLDDPVAIEKLQEILTYYSDRAEHFKSGRLTNTVESLNRMIVSFSSKNIHEAKNYPIAANLAALKKNEGFKGQLQVMKELGLTLSPFTTEKLKKHDEQREKRKVRQREYKPRKKEGKRKKRTRGKKVTDESNTYKGAVLPEQSTNERPSKRQTLCSRCKQSGHNKRTCNEALETEPPAKRRKKDQRQIPEEPPPSQEQTHDQILEEPSPSQESVQVPVHVPKVQTIQVLPVMQNSVQLPPPMPPIVQTMQVSPPPGRVSLTHLPGMQAWLTQLPGMAPFAYPPIMQGQSTHPPGTQVWLTPPGMQLQLTPPGMQLWSTRPPGTGMRALSTHPSGRSPLTYPPGIPTIQPPTVVQYPPTPKCTTMPTSKVPSLCECGAAAGKGHQCDICTRFMHGFCGTGIGPEGYGQVRRCKVCIVNIPIKNN